MKLSVDYLDRGTNASPEEAATVAELAIWVNNSNVTSLTRKDGSTGDSVIMPVYPFAEGIAFDWWLLLAGRGKKISLRRYRQGFVLPDVTLTNDGSEIEVNALRYQYDNPPLQFLQEATERITIPELEQELATFIDGVTARLRGMNSPVPLVERWQMIGASRKDAEERAFCEAAGALGLDPYRCDDKTAELIKYAASLFDGDDLLEALAGLTAGTAKAELEWVTQAERQIGRAAILPLLHRYRDAMGPIPTGRPPWKAGYDAARRLRGVLGLSPQSTMRTIEDCASHFGNPDFRPAATSVEHIRAVTRMQGLTAEAIIGGNRRPTAMVFAFARAVGNIIRFGDSRRSVVTELDGTFRQKFGRAFAAEFLAPGAAVKEMQRAGRTIQNIAEYFGVSTMVIDHQIANFNAA